MRASGNGMCTGDMVEDEDVIVAARIASILLRLEFTYAQALEVKVARRGVKLWRVDATQTHWKGGSY